MRSSNQTQQRLAAAPSVFLLGMLTAIDAMAIDSYVPALPAIGRNLGASAFEVQTTLAVFLVGIAAGQALWGPISDRMGRRAPLLWGLAFFCLGSFGSMVATSITTLVIARLLQALGASSGLVISRAIVSDLWPANDAARIYSVMMQILGLTALVAPLAGAGILYLSGWREIFLLLLVVGLATSLWTFAGVRESLPQAQRKMRMGVMHGYWNVASRPGFLMAALSSAFSTAAMFATISGSSFLFIDLFGWSSTEYAILYAVSSLLFVTACQINQWLLARKSDARLLRIGLVVQVVVALMMAPLLFVDAPWLPWIFALLWTILMANLGIIMGNAVAGAMRLAPPEHAGSASALLGVVQFSLSALVVPFATSGANLALSFVTATGACAILSFAANAGTRSST